MTALRKQAASTSLMARLIDAPDLARTVRSLPNDSFAALVRRIGVEDAAEIVALASTEQVTAAFDEDLFTNCQAGERESFDPDRFIVWLEILLEGGDDAAALRFSELSEPFVVKALSSILLVFDHDCLLVSMSEGGDDALLADKALESALSQEMDGYLLFSRKHEGWDAAIALILALDRSHRPLLERILDRCADLASPYLDDLAELSSVLSDEESLIEDVEDEREQRRSAKGYVEPRAARAFLKLAQQPCPGPSGAAERDPITNAYFRELASPIAPLHQSHSSPALPGLANVLEELSESGQTQHTLSSPSERSAEQGAQSVLQALQQLSDLDAKAFALRLEELAYLANVILAGASKDEQRFSPTEAAEAALATVSLGATLELRTHIRETDGVHLAATLVEVLRTLPADLLFRRASYALRSLTDAGGRGCHLLHSQAELETTLARL